MGLIKNRDTRGKCSSLRGDAALVLANRLLSGDCGFASPRAIVLALLLDST